MWLFWFAFSSAIHYRFTILLFLNAFICIGSSLNAACYSLFCLIATAVSVCVCVAWTRFRILYGPIIQIKRTKPSGAVGNSGEVFDLDMCQDWSVFMRMTWDYSLSFVAHEIIVCFVCVLKLIFALEVEKLHKTTPETVRAFNEH